ncbi:hypothetical protein [Streptomyces zaomyceticus]|uniref:hypothetical protein n=1 Tax=Streptomyces zaomyceticus TaxID=68286 RepID=UPI002E11DBEA|nr:hypothetical protein OG237_20430 [Streptomyces zaomyceticus]
MTVLDELLVRIGMDSSGVEEGVQETNSRLDGLAAPAAAAGLAAGAVFAAGIAGAMDIAEAEHKLQNQLGLTSVEAERAGGIAGDVFSSGFGESLEEVTTALGGVHSGIGELGTFTDAELQDMSESALALAKTFEVDVAEATGAVGQLMKTGLVKDATEGFDLVTKAMQQVPAELRGDLLPTIQEYSTQFRRVGLDGQTSMGLLAQAVKAGARDLDQVADGIGQFGERALAGGTAVDEAFKSIGLSSKDMSALIGKGGDSAEKALQMTMDALRGTSDEQVKLNAAAELFGDPANVMGEALFALDPATAAAASGMDKAAGSSKGLTDAMADSPTQQMNEAMRTLQTTLGETFLPILKTVSSFIVEHKDTIKEWLPIVLLLVVALGLMAAAIWIVNIAMMANPVGLIIAGIVALIAIVVVLVMKWDEVQKALVAYWEQIKADAIRVWDAIAAFFTAAWDKTVEDVLRVWTWITGFLTAAWDKTKADAVRVWTWITGFLTAAWDKTKADAVRVWSAITGWISDQWNSLVSFIRIAVDQIGGFFGGMWDGITTGLKTALNAAIWMINQAIEGINVLISGANMVPGVNIPFIPYIPFLAEGGITTGPTLAMIGEGSEQEAVLPLSKLEALISAPTTMAAPSTSKVQPIEVRVIATADRNGFRDFLQYEVSTTAGGSVARYAGEDD